jgi:hypothetical protein
MKNQLNVIMSRVQGTLVVLFTVIAFLSAGCGSGGSSGSSSPAGDESTRTTFNVTGKVTLDKTVGLEGASVTLTGSGTYTAITDANGDYSFMGLSNGSYMLTPSLEGYSFTPQSMAITINNADVSSNFDAAGSGPSHPASYEAKVLAATSAGFISQANEEGAKGYRFIFPVSFYNEETVYAIFINEGSQGATFSYEALTPAGTADDFIAQANAEGAKGYRYLTDLAFGDDNTNYAIYGKADSESAVFSYEALPPAGTAVDFVTQANAEGAKGFRYVSDAIFSDDGDVSSIYLKDSSQAATFSYEVLGAKDAPDDFVAQANTEGAKGFRYMTDSYLGGEIEPQSIYIKDNSRNSAFAYQLLDPTGTAVDLMTQANAEGEKGCRYLMDSLFSDQTVMYSVYVDVTRCTGVLLQIHPLSGW